VQIIKILPRGLTPGVLEVLIADLTKINKAVRVSATRKQFPLFSKNVNWKPLSKGVFSFLE
jgi:hypothetical protein